MSRPRQVVEIRTKGPDGEERIQVPCYSRTESWAVAMSLAAWNARDLARRVVGTPGVYAGEKTLEKKYLRGKPRYCVIEIASGLIAVAVDNLEIARFLCAGFQRVFPHGVPDPKAPGVQAKYAAVVARHDIELWKIRNPWQRDQILEDIVHEGLRGKNG